LEKYWILKDRAGYGSYGNRLVTNQEALSYANNNNKNMNNKSDSESVLCQKLVDPPLLINGRKFSLRVYVVCIPVVDDAVTTIGETYNKFYISTDGLVKLALLPYDTSVNNELLDDMHMTNSGRGEMDQCDFRFLREEIRRMRYNYDDLWEEIRQVVTNVMKRYKSLSEASRENTTTAATIDSSRSIFSLPKILGFDFIIDGSCHPMLIEVNRFPGLKPRDDSDAGVKNQVVMDAWYETMKTTSSFCTTIGFKEADMLKVSSLQPIDV